MRLTLTTLIWTVSAVFLWGLWGFWGKLALLQKMPPLNMFLAEVAVGFLIGLAVLLFLLTKGQVSFYEGPWNKFGLLSSAAMALGLFIYYFLLEKAQASIVVPVTSAYPIITVLLSIYFLGEKLGSAQWAGVVLIVIGMLLLINPANPH
jgi:bacterial/archaeal transporter family protein